MVGGCGNRAGREGLNWLLVPGGLCWCRMAPGQQEALELKFTGHFVLLLVLLELVNTRGQRSFAAHKALVEHGSLVGSFLLDALEAEEVHLADKAGVLEAAEPDWHDDVNELLAIVDLESHAVLLPTDDVLEVSHGSFSGRKLFDFGEHAVKSGGERFFGVGLSH